eukprot:6181095-Pleurochrysis_carterae.AAC.3
MTLSVGRRRAICYVSLKGITKVKLSTGGGKGNPSVQNIPRVSSVKVGRTKIRSPLYTGNAKPPTDHSILSAERELRKQGARRRDRDLGAGCLERRSGNQPGDRERGDRKSGRVVTKPKRSSMLSNEANVSIVCRPNAHTLSPQKLIKTSPLMGTHGSPTLTRGLTVASL